MPNTEHHFDQAIRGRSTAFIPHKYCASICVGLSALRLCSLPRTVESRGCDTTPVCSWGVEGTAEAPIHSWCEGRETPRFRDEWLKLRESCFSMVGVNAFGPATIESAPICGGEQRYDGSQGRIRRWGFEIGGTKQKLMPRHRERSTTPFGDRANSYFEDTGTKLAWIKLDRHRQ